MGSNTGKGMDTYDRILQDARVNNKPIGPQFHVYDRQRKEFELSQPEAKVLIQTRTATAIVTKEQTRANIKAKIHARVTAPRVPTLQEKYQAEKMKKIADGYKVEERNPEAKSVGNGL